MLDVLENVGVGLLLPAGKMVPVGDVGGLRVGDVLVDLGYPAGGDEAALLLAGQFRGGASADLDELPDLLADGGRGLPLPIGGFIPGRDAVAWDGRGGCTGPCPAVPEAYPGGTTFTGVHRLPGGHALHLDGNGRAHITRYEPEGGRESFDDAADALREALVTAVSVRAARARRLSSDFSGGLDSTTLALLATRAGHRVLAVTHEAPVIVNDDTEYAKRLAAGDDLLTHVVAASGSLFFDNLETAPPTDQPLSDTARWAVHAGFRQPVRHYSTDVHLTGSGGDTLLSGGPQALACLALAGPVKSAEFVRLAAARARLRHLPVHAVVGSALALSRTSYEQSLDRLAAEIRRPSARPPGRSSVGWVGHARMAAWLTPDTREHLAAAITASVPHGEFEPPAVRTAWNEVREFGTYQAELDAQAWAGGVPTCAPMLDNTVVRAAMSIPLQQRLSRTVQKPLLNAAFNGILPSLLLRRPTKGGYDGSGYAGIIDPQLVRDEIAALAAGVPGRMACLEAFIAADRWASSQDRRPRIRWRKGIPAHA